jgi:thiamine monophosphate synthase
VRIKVGHETEDPEHLAALARDRARRACAPLPLYLNVPGVGGPPHNRLPVSGYDGIHYPERCIPAAVPSKDAGADALSRGASVHSEPALRRAEAAGAAFAVFGPVWSPVWKEAEPQGIAALAALAGSACIPVLAIGGITPVRAVACLRSGAAGVAVASGVFLAADPVVALAAYARAAASVSDTKQTP